MDMKKLASAVAKKEGKKKELDIAQIGEVLAIVSDMMVAANAGLVIAVLVKNGERRRKDKNTKK